MNVKTISIRHLAPAPYNPRKPMKKGSKTYRTLKRSLKNFGLVEPLVWNERSGHVVGGHQRLQILSDLGWTDVPVCVVDLEESAEKALNVVLNNRQAQSDWDVEKLAKVLEEIQTTDAEALSQTGFSDKHLDELLHGLSQKGEVDVEQGPQRIEICLIVPIEKLEEVRPEIDALLGRFGLECHIRQR